MSESRSDEELQELMALDAVGALDDDERTELEAEIADRPDLQRELEELRAVAAAMADAVSEAPPATLRASVLDAIDGVEQLPAVDSPVEAAPPDGPGRADHRRSSLAAVGRRRCRRGGRRRHRRRRARDLAVRRLGHRRDRGRHRRSERRHDRHAGDAGRRHGRIDLARLLAT